MQIRVHQIHDEVHFVLFRIDDEAAQLNDVCMASQPPHETNFTQGMDGIHPRRSNWRNLLDRYFGFLRAAVLDTLCSTDDTIRTLSQCFDGDISPVDGNASAEH